MAIDPSIALQAGVGVTPLANPVDVASKYQALINAQSQNKLIGASTAATQAGTAKTQQDTQQSGGTYMASQLGTLAALPLAMQTQSAARQLVQHGMDAGEITPQEGSVWMQKVNETQNQGDLHQLIIRGIVGNVGGQAAVDNLFGSNGTMSNGASIQPGTITSPLQRGMNPGTPGFVPAGAPTNLSLSPAQKAGMVGTVDPTTGTPGNVPLSTLVNPDGTPKGGQPSGLPTGYPGNAAPTPAAPAAPAPPPGFTPSAVSPDFSANQQAYQSAQADVPAANTRIQSLQEARNALALTNSGPGEATIQKVRAFIQARGGPDFFTGQSDAATALATANKYLLKYAATQAGGNTDAGRAIAIDSNANTGQPQPATLAIVKNSIGQERLSLAATQTATNPTGQGFLQHKADFTSKYDPRAFAADLYTPQELVKIQQQLKGDPTGMKKFYDGLQKAHELGMIATPGQQ